MHCSSILIGLAALVFTSVVHALPLQNATSESVLVGMLTAQYKTAYLIDTKNYAALGEVMTDEVIYDSTPLGAYGGKSVGLAEVQASLAAAIADAKVEHLVTNVHIRELLTPTKAHTHTYITYSHWDETDLDDITKTFRIYYQCDDIWVFEDGVWKMDYSYVTNTGPKVEAPYFGDK